MGDPTYEPYPGSARPVVPDRVDGPVSFADAVPDPDADAYVWHVLVESVSGYLELAPGVYATKEHALEAARELAFGRPGPLGFRRTAKRVYRDGDGFVTTYGDGTAPMVVTRVMRLEVED